MDEDNVDRIPQQEIPLTTTQFVLSPDIPTREQEYFERFRIMFSKIMALGNIERRDILWFKAAYEEVTLLIKLGLYQEARNVIGEVQMDMQMSRSIDGFQTLFGQHGVERKEEVSKILHSSTDQPRRGFFSLFRKKEPPKQQMSNVGMSRQE